MTLTERDMLDRLNRRYATANPNGFRYARAEHVKLTAGFDSRRTCDYMALDLWPGNTGPLLHGHEVKVSRSDWLRELREPEKAEAFARYCDHWWIVAAPGIVYRQDLPEGWGLMEASNHGLSVRVSAAARTPEPLPRDLQATLARAITKTTIRLMHTDDAVVRWSRRRMGLTEQPVIL